MRRGTRVGQAYVAVTADGSGINKEIVDSVDEAGPGVERAGDEHGERYGGRFSEGFLARIRERFSSATIGESIDKGMGDDGDRAGDRLGARIGGHVIDALNFALSKEGGENPLSEMFDRITRNSDDDAERTGAALGDRLGESMGKSIAKRLDKRMKNTLEELVAKHQDFLIQMEDERAVSGNRGGRRGTSPAAAAGLGGIVGSIFGRGSRNNFLNILGGIVGKAVSLVEGLGKAALSMGSVFKKGFDAAGEGAGFFAKILSGVDAVALKGSAAVGKALPVALGVLAVAVLAIIPTLSILASVFGALVGIAAALASTIVSGLVGALAVGGAAMGALAVAGGLLTAAFTSMTDAQKKLLTTAFRPLKAEMVGLGQIMLRDMIPAFDTWSGNLQRALALATPVASVMGKAFADAGNSLTAALSGPGFQRLAGTLTVFLPGIVRKLSQALGGFLNGMAGLFSALLPYVDRFSRYLADVAQRFSMWANSAEGQNSIADFVDRALVSLESLWTFTKELGGLLSDVLFSPDAQGAGNSMFDGMARALQKLREKIADGSLERWFKDAKDFAEDLAVAIRGLSKVFLALYNSDVLQAVGSAVRILGKWWGFLSDVLGPVVDFLGGPLSAALRALEAPLDYISGKVKDLIADFRELLGLDTGSFGTLFSGVSLSPNDGEFIGPVFDPAYAAQQAAIEAQQHLDNLAALGVNSLNQTSEENGGWMREWKNPYVQWANSLINDGPGVAAQIREAIRSINKEIGGALRSIGKMFSKEDAKATLQSLTESIDSTAQGLVDAAQNSLNSAASDLASAGSPAEAQRALARVRSAQAALRDALKQQQRLEGLADMLQAQGKSSTRRVDRLLKGLSVENATLADYAAARGRLANRLQRANQQLQEAIQLRASYRSQVADAIKAFGALTTAQAKTVDGVEQALTAADITSNLQERLDKIKKFQENLRLLLAQGLSNAAYKQIVDQGVEGGSVFAEALLAGGGAAIADTNALVGQINDIAGQLGLEASNRLYQAGVDAARGLVDGLESLSEQLDRAATRLGNSIARAVKRALGIHSPSRVMFGMMDDVGDGAVNGLDAQRNKVGRAAKRFSDEIAVSPEVAAYAARQGEDPRVSGNQPDTRFRDLIIQTPTEDPEAVARETLNEITGRL